MLGVQGLVTVWRKPPPWSVLNVIIITDREAQQIKKRVGHDANLSGDSERPVSGCPFLGWYVAPIQSVLDQTPVSGSNQLKKVHPPQPPLTRREFRVSRSQSPSSCRSRLRLRVGLIRSLTLTEVVLIRPLRRDFEGLYLKPRCSA